LGKMEKKSRPQKHKKLAQAISSFFQKKISKFEVEAIIAKLIADKKISEKALAISYAF
jgi:transcriptional regulator CtsR